MTSKTRRSSAFGLGSHIVGFAQVCAGLEVIDDAELRAALDGVVPDGWYPIARLLRIEEAVRRRFPDHATILFRAGEELVRAYYRMDSIGVFRSGIQFLELQHDSAGYYRMILGDPAEIGEFSLVSLDRDRGTAKVLSTTPFDAQYERGVLHAGISHPGDMCYVSVDVEITSKRQKIYNVRFRSA